MLPPVDPAVLQRNPNFNVLYKDLRRRKLNEDGSTRDTKKQRIHDEIRRNLNTSRTGKHTRTLLIQTLSTLPSKSASLPSDLHSTIEVVTALLTGQIPSADRAILAGDVDFFLSNIDTIATCVSEQLTVIAKHLCAIADPAQPPKIEGLTEKAEEVKDAATRGLPTELANARDALSNTAYQVLDVHRQVLECGIRILEQTMHGSLARATKAKAELLHSRATVLGLQAKIRTLTHPPPSDFVAALKNFKAAQGTTEAALWDREALAKKALELYEKAGEKGMRDIARRADYLRREIARTREEIGELERGG